MTNELIKDINEYVLRVINVYFELCSKNSIMIEFEDTSKVYSENQFLIASYNKFDPNISATLRRLRDCENSNINRNNIYTRKEFYACIISDVLIGYSIEEVEDLKNAIIEAFGNAGSSLTILYASIVNDLFSYTINRKKSLTKGNK